MSAPTARQERDLDWIRTYYDVPSSLTLGSRVCFEGKRGTVIDTASGRLVIQLDGELGSAYYHPTWHMVYEDDKYRSSVTLTTAAHAEEPF
jgi:hypothetical protein